MDIASRIRQGIESSISLHEIYLSAVPQIGKIDFYKAVLSLIDKGEIPNVLQCYCGHDCSRCRTFHATLTGDSSMKKSIAAFYQQEFGLSLSEKQIHCLSVRSDEIMQGCGDCPFMACCKEKGYRQCTECSQYPCEMLAEYMAKYVNKVNQV